MCKEKSQLSISFKLFLFPLWSCKLHGSTCSLLREWKWAVEFREALIGPIPGIETDVNSVVIILVCPLEQRDHLSSFHLLNLKMLERTPVEDNIERGLSKLNPATTSFSLSMVSTVYQLLFIWLSISDYYYIAQAVKSKHTCFWHHRINIFLSKCS